MENLRENFGPGGGGMNRRDWNSRQFLMSHHSFFRAKVVQLFQFLHLALQAKIVSIP
jgi:hypothetical protein